MVDAPTKVSLKRVSKIVPVCVLNYFRVELPKDIDEPPTDRLFVCRTSVDMEIDIIHPFLGMVHINRFWCHVKITKPDSRHQRIERCLKIRTQAPKPSKLKRIFF